jgi:hypothetical protein
MNNKMAVILVVVFFGFAGEGCASDALKKELERKVDDEFASISDLCGRQEALSSARFQDLTNEVIVYAECYEEQERIRLLGLVSVMKNVENLLVHDDHKMIPQAIQALEGLLVLKSPEDRKITEGMIEKLKQVLAEDEMPQ